MSAIPRPRSSGRLHSRLLQRDEGDEESPSLGRSGTASMTSLKVHTTRSISRGYIASLAAVGILGITWIGGFWPFGSSGDPNTLVFLSVGDFGVGTPDAKGVAAQMAITAKENHANFFVSLGDNVYEEGVKDERDPKFWSCFEDVFHQPPLQKQWLMTLGDHDHRGSVMAQVAFSRRSQKWHMPAPYYATAFEFGRGPGAATLEIFTTDSVSLEAIVASDDPADRRFCSDYNQTVSGRKAGKRQLRWLKKALGASRADWKVVVGHRPILTAGIRPRFPADAHFPGLLQPIMEKYQVDAYMFGHDHVGQHLEQNGVAYLGNGVGGYGLHEVVLGNTTVWADSKYLGFMLHRVTADTMVTDFMDKDGAVKHTLTLSKKRPVVAGSTDTKATLR